MRQLAPLAAFALFLGFIAPVYAHHGNAGRFDETLVSISGSVVELELINPHSIIVLDASDSKGKLTRWQAEMIGPNALIRDFGWTRDTLKPGDKVTLIGRKAKSGAPYMNLTERAVVYMTDSKRLLFRTNSAEVPKDVIIPAGMGAASPASSGASY